MSQTPVAHEYSHITKHGLMMDIGSPSAELHIHVMSAFEVTFHDRPLGPLPRQGHFHLLDQLIAFLKEAVWNELKTSQEDEVAALEE